MTKKVKAIVIKNSDSKEKDKNVLLFSIDEGKIWATLKGVRSDKAKMKYAKEPFCFGEFVIEEGKISNVVTAVDIIETFGDLSKDIEKFFEGSALLEIVSSISFDSERYQIFISLIKALKCLTYEKTINNIVLTKFMLDIFEIFGVKVYSEKCSCCGSDFHDHINLNFDVGELVCQNCKSFQSEELTLGQFKLLKLLSENDYEKLSTLKFSQELTLQTLKLLVKNFYLRFDKHLKFIGILN